MIIASAVAFGAFEILAGLMPTYELFALSLIPVGVTALTLITSANAKMQLGVDPLMRGRVMALYMVVFFGGTPLGAPIVGAIGETFGARWTLLAGGLVTRVAPLVLAALLARRQGWTVHTHLHPPRVHVRDEAARPADTGRAAPDLLTGAHLS